MITKLLQFNQSDLALGGELIRKGELVAFPTETVYGLGANAYSEKAVKQTYVAKGRPSDNPEIVHIWHKSQFVEVAQGISADVEKLIDTFMPGSLTLVVAKKSVIPDCVTAGFSTVAVRIPQSNQAREFLRAAAVPVAGPSANTSGRPSPTSWQTVKEDLDGKISAIFCGDKCAVGIESTVLDTTRDELLILRPGVVTPSAIAKAVNRPVTVLTDPNSKVNSPGVRYTHYAPHCQMVLNLDGDKDKLNAFYDKLVVEGKKPVLLTDDTEGFSSRKLCLLGKNNAEVAQNAFSALRACEKAYDYIICSFHPQGEFGQSIVNRLLRSASHKIL